MVVVKLVGVHKVTVKLADGSPKTYYYAWRGGPAIAAKPGTVAFSAEYHRRLREHETAAPVAGSLSDLIAAYCESAKYQHRKASTKKGYDWAIGRIEHKYGAAPLAVIEKKGSRRSILRWRDETFGTTPRAADMVIAVFSTILNFGVDREDIARNPLAGADKLSAGTRRDIIWSDAQVAAFKAKAPPRMVLALELARWTGQRQGDLLRLTWAAYDGQYLTLKQSKTGATVHVKIATELKSALDAEKARRAAKAGEKVGSLTILTNRAGRPFKTGFGSSWAKALDAAKVSGVTFHDLRGTFITLAYRDGASIKEIAEVSGHTEKDAERIIRKHYLKSDGAVTKLELGNESRRKL